MGFHAVFFRRKRAGKVITMRSNIHDFINAAKAKALDVENKQPTQALFNNFESTNTIFNQQKLISLNKKNLIKTREAIDFLDKAVELINGARAILHDFDELDLGALRMAGNFTLGTSYMLEEFLKQQKGQSDRRCDFKTRHTS